MKEEMSIDELLNGFVDGELTTRQETEVRRLIKNDPQMAQQLQRLQKSKLLMNSLPAAELPSYISDNIKSLVEAGTQSSQYRPAFQQRTGTRNLLYQRITAVAAMIGLVVVLTAVMYTLEPPETAPNGFDGGDSSFAVVATTGFSGKLELKTKEFTAVDSFVTRTIEDNGYTDFLSPTQETNRRLYLISCSKEGLDRLLADLDNIWDDKLDSSTLHVETGTFSEQVVVNAVTTEQIAEIASQNSSNRSIEVAKDYAVLNGMAKQLPGRDVFSAIEDRMSSLMKIHKPILTEKIIEKPEIQEEGEKTIHLTIIVSR